MNDDQKNRYDDDTANAIRNEIEHTEELAQEAAVEAYCVEGTRVPEAMSHKMIALGLTVDELRTTLALYIAYDIDPVVKMRDTAGKVLGKALLVNQVTADAHNAAATRLEARLRPSPARPEPVKFA